MPDDFWKDYFSFSRRERIAVFILFGLIVLIFLLPYVWPKKQPEQIVFKALPLADSANDLAEANKQSADTATISQAPKAVAETALFYFDPNTLNEEGFKKLGLNTKLINTIVHYRNKGGHFNKPADLGKVYGLSKADAERLMPYVQIEKKQQAVAEPVTASSKTTRQIDINTATVDDWKALPGIGDVLANRIVKFRNSMHGFKDVSDIKRTYGLKDSTYQIILPYLILSPSK
jgi:DNA uptake protein ComE-like DNA-binding protein